ncbi:nucleobase:cation symporter-1, NCS1 family [Geodermatophilus dictyosporus]|uniref:Nucleobase:cation symporter-1, NCS1 family n=1 Tax=Geodermatophilus dictyosporus TaxID=1523247 RepID=A0A1I5JZM2_9ACTN|nr:cytosine permease [Geodermatophilus dictyosporus]SFO78255.1 nucleobase:cation symporter-1, NCS1 family [Geodermatophilus dictyosporus]
MAAHEDVSREATFGSLPVTRDERVWNFADFTWVNVGLAIATWAFLVGGATASLVGFADGLLAMVIGNAIGVVIMLLASVVASQRYGVEQYTVLRSVFGFGGVALIVFTVILFTEMGWSSLLSVMFGRAVSQVSNEALGTSIDPSGLAVTAFALVAIVAAWVILAKGPLTIRFFNRIVAPGLAVLTVGMLVLVFTETSWSQLVDAAPLAPFEDEGLNFALAVEFNLGVGFSWWPVMGSLARLTTTPRAAMWPAFIGLFGATILAQAVGMAAALTLGDSDPTVWMVPLGGAWLGALALVFVAFANLTSLASIVYSTCLALRQAGGHLLTRVPWPWLCAGFFVLPGVLAFFPGLLYDQFLLFVTWTGAFLAAICGTVIADYFVLRRQRIDLRGLYGHAAASPYHFTGGFNVAALLSTGLGALTYVLLYNPQTLETRPAFDLLTASVPAVVVAAVAHLLLTALLVRRAGRGGYDAPPAPVAERSGERNG